jgi:hypothetical protein
MKPTPGILNIAVGVIAGALLAGGSYALGAGSSSKTITSCVVKKTHELLVQNRCGRGESRLTWSQQGPRGVQGNTGPQGPPAASAWARIVPGASSAIVSDGENLSVQQDGNGVFTLTAGAPCTSGTNPSEVVTPSFFQVGVGGIPVAYVVNPNGPGTVFQVVTGTLSDAGTFTQNNGVNFSVAVFCHQS